MLIKVSNNGFFNEMKESETGFGLKNTRERLKYVYGNDASIEIFNDQNNLVITNIQIPKYENKS